jgi:hypothetical protein
LILPEPTPIIVPITVGNHKPVCDRFLSQGHFDSTFVAHISCHRDYKIMSVKRRTLVWCSVSGLLLIVSLAVAWKIHADRAQSDLADALAETDRADPGWRLAEIEAHREVLPPASGGPSNLELVQMAAERFPELPWPLWPFPQIEDRHELMRKRQAMTASFGPRPNLFDAEQIRASQAELGRAQASLDLLRQLPAAPRVPMNETSPAWDILSRSNVSNLMFLLHHDAQFRANNGDMHGAMTNVIAMLELARCVGDRSSFQIQWHRLISIHHHCLLCLRSVLALGEAADNDLATVQRLLAEEAKIRHLLLGLRSERARADAILDQFQRGDISLAEACYLLSTEFHLLETHVCQGTDRIRLLVDLDAERAQLLRSWLPIIELVRGKSADIEDLRKRQAARLSGPQAMPDYLLSASVVRIDEVLAEDIRLRRDLACAVCVLAAERFRLANGHWPSSFAELVPQYLDVIPRPVIESPTCAPVYANSMFKAGSFALYDVDKRRQPAK